jgi:excisionase family DNA binding protein
MGALLDRPDTVVPTDADAKLAAESSRILARRKSRQLRVQLDDGETLTLPRAATRLLTHLLTEMGQGHAVTLIPIHAELTTQRAAEYLNVSRPFVIRLLEEGKIPFHKVGTHRRIRFHDLRAYREASRKRTSDALDALAAEAQDLKLGY